MVNDLATAAPRTAAVDVANRLRPVLLQLNRQLRRETREVGISGGQASLLHLIHQNPGVGVGELAQRERISAPGMVGHVDRLEAAGLVARTRSETDRRRVGLTATDEGRRLLKAVRRRRTAWLAERLKSLDGADLEALDRAIEPLGRLLEDDE